MHLYLTIDGLHGQPIEQMKFEVSVDDSHYRVNDLSYLICGHIVCRRDDYMIAAAAVGASRSRIEADIVWFLHPC